MARFPWMPALLLLLLLLLLHISNGTVATEVAWMPPIVVSLVANWNRGPFAVQLLETLSSLVSAADYFAVLTDRLSWNVSSASTDSQVWRQWTDVDIDNHHDNKLRQVLQRAQWQWEAFQLAVAMQESSPALQVHYQHCQATHGWAVKSQSPTELHVSEWDGWRSHCPMGALDQDAWVAGYGVAVSAHEDRAFLGYLCDGAQLSDRLEAMDGNPAPLNGPFADALPFQPFPQDHTYPRMDSRLPVLVLYGALGDASFLDLHLRLMNAADRGRVVYVQRWRPHRGHWEGKDRPALAGYGIELALKSTEYLVTDDQKLSQSTADGPQSSDLVGDDDEAASPLLERADYNFTLLKSLYPDRVEAIESFRLHIKNDLEEVPRVKPLVSRDLEDLGYRLVEYCQRSPFPLVALARTMQDFPKHASWIARQNSTRSLEQEVEKNRASGLLEGNAAIYLNGILIEPTRSDLFRIVRASRMEAEAATDIANRLNWTMTETVSALIRSKPVAQNGAQESIDVYDLRMPWEKSNRKRAEGDWPSPVLWWNDLERDGRYKQWPSSIRDVLRPQFQGGIPRIRKNMFSAIFIMDMGSRFGLQTLSSHLSLITNDVPVRFGLIPMVPLVGNSENGVSPSECLAKSLYILSTKYGLKAAAEFIDGMEKMEFDKDKLIDNAGKVWNDITSKLKPKKDGHNSLRFSDMCSGQTTSDLDLYMRSVKDVQRRLAVGFGSGKNGALVFNGQFVELDHSYQQELNQMIQAHLSVIQRMVYFSQLSDSIDLREFFLRFGTVRTRRNPFLAVSDERPVEVIDLDSSSAVLEDLREIVYMSNADSATRATFWVFVNLDRAEDILMMHSAHEYLTSSLRGSKKSRFAFFAISGDADKQYSAPSTEIGNNVRGNQESFRNRSALNSLLTTLNPERGAYLVLNGRVLGPFPENYAFSKEDFEQYFNVEEHNMNAAVAVAKSVDGSPDPDVVLILHWQSLSLASRHLSSNGIVDWNLKVTGFSRRDVIPLLSEKFSVITVGSSEAPVHLTVLMDPLTPEGQRMAVMLEQLSKLQTLYFVKLFLLPRKISSNELPVKRFYRMAIPSKLQFSLLGNLQRTEIRFRGIPQDPLLTLGVDSPQAWLVMPTHCIHDLDNVKLKDVDSSRGVQAELELKYLLIEGHARDVLLQAPPRGLQFIIAAPRLSPTSDTIVMANLGYYQLKANPGVWELRVREGRSTQFYNLLEIFYGAGVKSATNNSVPVIVDRFEGTTLFTKVSKNPDKAGEDLLSEDGSDLESKNGDWLFSWINPNRKPLNSRINVFSVASGHLYERFLRIMIISVLRQTKHPVKFWFIENFLSPLFKNFMPVMAKEYGFEYEFVTYKWPQWLRFQTEKQRLIWGYKILFLDVIFPLSLDKVIFVDADQIVRADLMELVTMDLKGAPYGYTPFCESRSEIDGFRFWKNGFWKDHLAGKPYHISALYVIDLNRFRQIAAGDRLRHQYHMLSADPNSLANLDQDLPNYMQHQVPIHSLSQDWLWCETWCSDESLKTAKTIDLCNNPMTKEPKLQRAQRLLPEWTVYDNEARSLYEKWQGDHFKNSTPVINTRTKIDKDEL